MVGCAKCERCQALLRDREFIFRSMWGAEPWQRWPQPFFLEDSCFGRARDHHSRHQDPSVYFKEAASGKHCATNWCNSCGSGASRLARRSRWVTCAARRRYEGNSGDLGRPGRLQPFHAPAPALLGFDDSIDRFCYGLGGRGDHAYACVAANMYDFAPAPAARAHCRGPVASLP